MNKEKYAHNEMKRTEIKRMLLQIKTSDKNVNHRFQTHWETIKPGSFTKVALLRMCSHLGISCPTRMCKGEVFTAPAFY